MPLIMPRMTLRQLLEEYGIDSMLELRRRTGLSKQYAWSLWHGKVNVGRELGERLAAQLEIPLERVLTVNRMVRRSERRPGRPPKPSDEKGPPA